MKAPNERTPGEVGTGRALREADEAIVRDASGDDKRFANVRATCCLAGHELHRHGDGQFEARRWGWARTFADLDAIEDWLASVTGRKVA